METVKRKVIALGSGPDGCLYYRIYIPRRHSKLFELDVDWRLRYADIHNRKRKPHTIDDFNDAEAVIFQRAESYEELAMIRLLKARGKKVIYEVDDALNLIDRDDAWKGHYNDTFVRLYEKIIRECDLVIVSTDYIRKTLLPWNKNVITVENRVDTDDYFEVPKKKSTKLRILLAGSVVQNQDSGDYAGLIDWIVSRPDMQLVVFGWLPKEHRKTEFRSYEKNFEHLDKYERIELHHGVQIADYFGKIQELNCDVCIVPRRDNDFNRGKSPIKFWEASMAGMATVAQSFKTADGPYDIEKAQGAPILLAQDEDGFKRNIEALLDEEYREKVARDSKEWVIKNRNAKDTNWDLAVSSVLC